MATNFRNKISMQLMRSWIVEGKYLLLSLVGVGGGFFFKLCFVWRMDYPLFTFHLDNQLSIQVFFFVFFCFVKKFLKVLSKQRVPKFLTCTPKSPQFCTSLLPHMFWQMLSFFTNIGGPNGRNSILQNKTFYF